MGYVFAFLGVAAVSYVLYRKFLRPKALTTKKASIRKMFDLDKDFKEF